MTKFVLDRRLMQMVPEVNRTRPTVAEVYRKVKRVNFNIIRSENITDDEINSLITKVMKGIRNTMYLFPDNVGHKRLRPIFETINQAIPFGSEHWPQ